MTVTQLPPPSLEAALVTVVDRLAEQAPADLAPAVALERTRLLMAQSERIKTLALRGLADIEARQLHTLDGAPTTASWVQAQGVPGVDQREVALARRLHKVPRVAEELLAGRLSAAAAAQLITALTKARPFLDKPDGLIDGMPADATLYGVLVDGILELLAEQTGGAPADDPEQDALRAELEALDDPTLPHRDRVEACFVLFAQRCQPALLPSGLALLLDALLPAQHEERARRADEDTGFDLHRNHSGSGWLCRGNLDDLTGEMLATVIAAQQAVDPQNPHDTDAWRDGRADGLGDTPPEHWPAEQHRPRSKKQQRHDALRAALRRLLDDRALGNRDKAAPHISIVVGLDYLHGVPGALPGRAMHGSRLSRQQLRSLLCNSTFTRMVLSAKRRVVEVSHTQRTLTALERMIVHLQWGGRCAGAGCARGPATGDPLVPHHAELFSHTGTTSVDDAIPLCKQDHHYLHDDHRVLRLKDGREIGPEGWVRRTA